MHDVHLVAEALTKQLDRIGWRAVPVRRVDPDDAGNAVEMAQRHLPDNETAPVVADEDRLVDLEMVEQSDEVAGQVLHVVVLDRLGPVGRAIAALIRRDHPDAGLAQGLDLVTPGKRDLRPAVAQDDRRLVGARPRLVIAHANTVHLGELQRRHFNHRQTLFSSAGHARRRRERRLQRFKFAGSMSHMTWTWGMMLAPAMKPKSSWSR